MDLEDYLGQFSWRDPDPALKARILGEAAAAPPGKRRWPWVFGAAAAMWLTAAVGYWIWKDRPVRDSEEEPSFADGRTESEEGVAPVAILGGRGLVVPVESE